MAIDRSYSRINRDVHERAFAAIQPSTMVERLRQYRQCLDELVQTRSSWRALYVDKFADRLSSARVLDLGSGDGIGTLIMASFGARVLAVDIAPSSGSLIREAAKRLDIADRIDTETCDILDLVLPTKSFDFVVGKGFLHHLTHDQEEYCLEQCARWLKTSGEARFSETAENNRLIDQLRWYIPLPGRPSCLDRAAFRAYKAINPSHPPRNNSSKHFRQVCSRFFEQVTVIPAGGVERFHRLLPPNSRLEISYRVLAGRIENVLPYRIHMSVARGQSLILRRPITSP